MLSSRIARYALGGVVVVVLLLGAWTVWQVWQVNKDLTEAVDRADAVKAAVEAGDQPRLEKEIKALQTASTSAADRTAGFTWSVLTKLPKLGDDAEGVEVAAQVLDDLATNGVAPLADVSDRIDDLLPRDGAIDVAAVQALQEPIAQAQRAFAEADAALAGQDPSGFVGRLRSKFTDFADQVSSADSAMSSARITADLLPTLLGADEPQNLLLVFQNNAEIRATGGLPGAVSMIHTENGRLEIKRQVAGADFGRAEAPVLPLTPAEKKLYTDQLGLYFLDANYTPDVGRASDLMVARWQQVYPRDQIDGVLMLDTVTLAYVLDATGPITVDGITLTGDTVVDELLHNSYLRLPDPKAQDAFFAKVAAASFDRFTSGAESGTALVEALARAADERRTFVHLVDPDLQVELAGTAVAGELLNDREIVDPDIAVTLNDNTGAKMSYFLRYDADVNATYCTDGVQGYSGKLRLRSVAPPDAAALPDYITGAGQFGVDAGTQLVTVRFFPPAGGTISDFELNAKKMGVIKADDGRPVAMTYIQLEPGQTVDLAWKMKSSKGQTGETDFSVTPTIEQKDNATTIASAC